jgi:hypothetical protein
MAKSKACTMPEHQKMEDLNKQRGKAAFTLTQRLQHARVSHPTEAVPTSDVVENDDLEEHIEWFEADGPRIEIFNAQNPGSIGVADGSPEEQDPCPSTKNEKGNKKIKAQFGRRRTHNEQTLVRPCGIIFARATMFGAEAVSNFLVGSISISIALPC